MNQMLRRIARSLVPVGILAITCLSAAKSCQAAVKVTVTHSGPTEVNVGDSLSSVVFTADVDGTPNANNECQIDNLVYSWSITVTGSDGGVRNYTSSGPTASAPHTANNLCQSYSISAACTVTYDTSPECETGSSSSTPGSDGANVQVNNTPCDP